MSASEIQSYEPATGALYWRGATGDVDTEVGIARASWAEWAAQSITLRSESLRRFVNVVRGKSEELTDCISRETGKRSNR
jgi:succinylglutamic semialdehyde dehydrogenase